MNEELYKKTLMEVLKEKRKETGLSQRKVSEMSGLSVKTLTNIETGRFGSITTIFILAEFYGLSLTELFSESDKKIKEGAKEDA